MYRLQELFHSTSESSTEVTTEEGNILLPTWERGTLYPHPCGYRDFRGWSEWMDPCVFLHLCGCRDTQIRMASGVWLWAWLGSTGNTPWKVPQTLWVSFRRNWDFCMSGWWNAGIQVLTWESDLIHIPRLVGLWGIDTWITRKAGATISKCFTHLHGGETQIR